MIRARPVTFAGGLLLEDAPEEQKKKRNFAEEGRGESEEREREREVSRNGTRRKKGRGDDKILE